jgi:hypothetical protein
MITGSSRDLINVTVQNASAITTEAIEVLMERLPASKAARLLSSRRIGQGDYLKQCDELFTGESVDNLFDKANPANTNK